MNVTQGFILSAFIVLLTWTAIASRFGQPTVSMAMRDLGWKYTSFSATMGILMGHWFYPSVNPLHRKVGNVLPFLILFLLFDLCWERTGNARVWWRYPGIWVVIGAILGANLWAQRLIGVSLPF